MNASQLKPVSQLAKRYGIKVVLFGGPGSGKTPTTITAPRPVLCLTEPGTLSIRGSNVPAKECYTANDVVDFLQWFMKSNEAKQFDTLGIDSLTNIAEIILADELKKQKHGLKAFGTMSERVMTICNDLFYMPEKHVVMIAKQGLVENGKQTMIQDGTIVTEPVMQKRPVFPGKDLNIKIPHLFDCVWHLGQATIQGQQVTAIRTRETSDIFARDRAGNLNELEQPNLTNLFNKAMKL